MLILRRCIGGKNKKKCIVAKYLPSHLFGWQISNKIKLNVSRGKSFPLPFYVWQMSYKVRLNTLENVFPHQCLVGKCLKDETNGIGGGICLLFTVWVANVS